jgi:hypothetical protein
MKNALLIISIFLLTVSQASAHSGRTDKNGGHNCSAASIKKGLCTGYHYHNGGGLHLDSTDEVVSLDSESKRDANALLQSHRIVEDHSHHQHEEHDDHSKEITTSS